jgi:hypothetical protein
VRDGGRAVVLAERVVAVEPTIDRGETLAMALAEAGRWEEAVARQRRVLVEEESKTGSASERRRRRLALDEQRPPVRAPRRGQPRRGSRSCEQRRPGALRGSLRR